MKKLFAALLIAGNLFTCTTADAEVKTYTGTDEYIMSEFETIDIAKQRARQKAERNAQEKAGVYISSYSETKNLELVTDEVVSIACGILSVVDVKYEVTPLADVNGFAIRATVKANVDTDDVNKWLEKSAQEKSSFVMRNKELQQAVDEQNATIEKLKAQVEKLKAGGKLSNKRDREQVTQEFAAEDKNFLATQKLDEAQKFFYNRDYNAAIKLCDESIKILPTARAYAGRGGAYGNLKNFTQTIADCMKAIELDPNYAMAYNNRGSALGYAGNYEQAMEDICRAIELDPNFALAYNNRAALCLMAGNLEQAFADANKAIALDPKLDLPYMVRGTCYQQSGDFAKAQADFNKARELGYKG